MMSSKDPLIYLKHIRDCCERIATYASESGPDWPSQQMVMDAVCRNLEIVGEAARKTDPEFRQAHPEVPWRSMIGARNILIHAYESLRPQIVREIVERDLPPLLAAVHRLLEKSAD